ncbi:RES family NAD+ phosphorylase [Acinetobacter guillouiae]|uniref:RES family NAD+ phosphorylase n=1 Tax=Acinetobacter guillouiae TaxID=106649 RepID=UPI003AF893C3
MNSLEGMVICKSCLDDQYLIKQMLFNKSGQKQKCTNCNKVRKCVDYKILAVKLKNVIRNHYSIAEQWERDWEYDNFYSEGENLQDVIENLIGSISNINSIIDYICTQDAWDAKDGDNRFFDNTEVYVKKRIYADEFHKQWIDLVTELKTSRRFFSDNARDLFGQIFKDVENLISIQNPSIQEPVIRVILNGTPIFRARRADTYEECKSYVKNPKKELSPPPSKFAQQGRMNAKGVSVFYGALNAETCIAEMRSSIGNYLVLGTFTPVKDLRILDFKRLESVISEISYFQSDARYQILRKQFLHKLHDLISSPVISGYEDEYLITQVLAEYLAYVREKSFDGISFESTQMNGGTNIIIFPKKNLLVMNVPCMDDVEEVDKDKSVLNDFRLEFINDSVEIRKTEKIKYETSPLSLGQFLE